MKLTKYFIFISIVLIIIYDIFAICSYGVDATISRLVIDWSYDYPILVLPVGVLMGHFFWSQPNPEDKESILKLINTIENADFYNADCVRNLLEVSREIKNKYKK